MIYDDSGLHEALRLVSAGVLSVDASGAIWRHAIIRAGAWMFIGRRRAENVNRNGYLRLSLRRDGKLWQVMAHRLVFSVSTGKIPDPGVQVNHKDLNRQNNHPLNLEPLCQSRNIRHSYDNGRTRPWALKKAAS